MGSQVIVNGRLLGNMKAADYFAMKKSLIPDIMGAYDALATQNDIIVIKGAGSPAEINLKQDGIVNMGMAHMAKAPVLLVVDIDRGGVFAQLAGTLMLLNKDEQAMVKATVINKFRGYVELLRPGLDMLYNITGKPVAGVLPYLKVNIEAEDSLSQPSSKGHEAIDIAVIRFPRISNFTDLAPLEATPGMRVRYISSPLELGTPDMLVLPGTKNTIADLLWLRSSGLEDSIKALSHDGTLIIGICGGYQMLGRSIKDPEGVEGGGETTGLGLLPVHTIFRPQKHRTRTTGSIMCSGELQPLNGLSVYGYEIHVGSTSPNPGAQPLVLLDNGLTDGCISGNVLGNYLHGFFDSTECRQGIINLLCHRKGINPAAYAAFDYSLYKEQQYNLLADTLRSSLDMSMIYRILEEGI